MGIIVFTQQSSAAAEGFVGQLAGGIITLCRLDAIGISLLRQAAVEVVRETVRTPDPVGQACQTVDRIISIANGAGKSGKLSTAAGQVIDIADRTVRLLYRQRPVHGIEGRLHRADGILEGGDVTDRV